MFSHSELTVNLSPSATLNQIFFFLFQGVCVLPVSLELELERLTVTGLDCICDYFLELTGKMLMVLKLRPGLCHLMFS